MTLIPPPSSTSVWNPDDDLTPVEVELPPPAPSPSPHGEQEAGGSGGDGTMVKRVGLMFLCRFPGCGRQFQLKGNLKRHQSIHRGDKQYTCDVCGRGFLRKADLEVHHRVHTGEKPYECHHDGCGKKFARRSDLLSHERTHSGSKPFACEVPGCGRRFARRFDLHKHQRVHEEMTSQAHTEGNEGARAGAAFKPSMKRRLVASRGVDDPTRQIKNERKPMVVADLMGGQQCCLDRGVRTGNATAERRTGRLPMAPISPSDHAAGPGKEFHFELKCTEDHVHLTPDCFSMEEWDAILGGGSGGSIAMPAGSAEPCCAHHLQNIVDAFSTASPADAAAIPAADPVAASTGPTFEHQHDHSHGHNDGNWHGHTHGHGHSHNHSHNSDHAHGFLRMTTTHPTAAAMAPTGPAPSAAAAASGATSTGSQPRMPQVHSPCPIVATAKLDDYSAHTSCGHLAIQHGDHRDFVVKNHLVCLDNVTSLSGDCGGSSGGGCVKSKQPHGAKHASSASNGGATHAAQDPHRPGCGHLAVRHGDHIDYVVEDNLFCQHVGGLLDGADQIELLDEGFWDFYGAMDSLKTD